MKSRIFLNYMQSRWGITVITLGSEIQKSPKRASIFSGKIDKITTNAKTLLSLYYL